MSKFLVVLDRCSPIGSLYIDKGDLTFGVTGCVHPVLRCTEINLDNPNYISLVRAAENKADRHSRIWVRHSAVLLVHEYDYTEPLPIGFAAPKQRTDKPLM